MLKNVFLFLQFFGIIILDAYGGYPFRNTSLPWDVRVADLVHRLTLEEIMMQMSKGGSGPKASPAPPIPRLGIGPYSWDTECLRGDGSAGNATSYPQAIGLAASFSTETVFSVAEATAIEVRAKYNDYRRRGLAGDHKGISCFSPVINIMRHPLWGRNQETYGEDPFLSGVLAASFVKGLQGPNPRYLRANAGCKHFDVHGGPENIPVSRFSFNAVVSQRDWRTTFLPAFRKCVDAGAYSLMCSFNRINGVPACGNKKLLTDILRKEWGFKGYVVSDQAAIENIIDFHHYLNNSVDTAALCINAGCNLELSTNLEKPTYFSMLEAMKEGKLDKITIVDSVKPLFYTRMRLGEFDPPAMNPYNYIDLSFIQSPHHRQLSLEAAIKSFVLLKNIEGFLPIKQKIGKAAVVGPMANNAYQQFGSYSADMNPTFTTTPLDGLRQIAKITNFAAGCADNKCQKYNNSAIRAAVSGVDVVFVCLGTGQELESEDNDRSTMNLPGQQLQLLKDSLKFSDGKPVVLIMFNAGPLNITKIVNNINIKSILECFFPAQTTGEALRRVLTNEGNGSNPAGRLPFTWPRFANQVPPITNYSMEGRTYRYFKGDPLFPFGFGLSYSSFHYFNVWHKGLIEVGQKLEIRVEVGNTGIYDGEEVIQVYIQWETDVPVPKIQLVAFKRVHLLAKEKRNFILSISPDELAVWTDQGFVIKSGKVQLHVGGQQPFQKTAVSSNILSRLYVRSTAKIIYGPEQLRKKEKPGDPPLLAWWWD